MTSRAGVLEPAPPRAGDGSGGGDHGRWAWLVTARDTFEGQLLQGLLENAGVPVALDGFDRGPFAWMYPSGNVMHPVQVFVPAVLLETAKLELLESSLVAADRLDSAAASHHADASAGERVLLRDRIRPLYLIVGLLTAVAVGWFIVVEILGFAPCAAHILCVNADPVGRGGHPVIRTQGLVVSFANS